MNSLKKLTISALLLTGLAISSVSLAQSPFDGKDVNVKFEVWEVDADNNFTSVLSVINEQDITASDSNSPDAEGFHAMDQEHNLWDIDFKKRHIELVFTSIQLEAHENQYMYMSPVGFSITDTVDNMSDILHVTIDDSYAPSFFSKDLASFDANNIKISLQGSMCHKAGMASMPDCANTESPTGYNSIIKLEVIFADNVDDLYDWAEHEYSDLFPGHEESFYLLGYYVREYPDYYLGTKDGMVYLYDKATLDIIDLGAIGPYLDQIPMDCPEGQHMMPDGMCMDNGMMGM